MIDGKSHDDKLVDILYECRCGNIQTIRYCSAASKILFVSENRSADVVREALSTGAGTVTL